MTVPFSSPVNVRTLPGSGRHVDFSANAEVRTAIAEENGLIDLPRFEATALLKRWKRHGVSVEGQVTADVIQPCAVSGEPLHARVDETFRVTFLPEGSAKGRPTQNGDVELIIDADSNDPPETLTGDSIDLAEIWLEFFVLGLDPFLRLDGAEWSDHLHEQSDNAQNPAFAALKSLKKH